MNGKERSTARDFDREAAPDLSRDGWPEKFAKATVRRGRPADPIRVSPIPAVNVAAVP